MLLRNLATRREFRARVERDATDLMLWVGEKPPTEEARQGMREARGRRDRNSEKLWTKVAVYIARETEHEIGADCWPEPPPRVAKNRRQVRDAR